MTFCFEVSKEYIVYYIIMSYGNFIKNVCNFWSHNKKSLFQIKLLSYYRQCYDKAINWTLSKTLSFLYSNITVNLSLKSLVASLMLVWSRNLSITVIASYSTSKIAKTFSATYVLEEYPLNPFPDRVRHVKRL